MGWLARRPFRWFGRYLLRPCGRALIGFLLRRRLHEWSAEERRQSALVFAPHPDDETLGCGGTIVRKKRAGAVVKIVVMTDGSASHPGQIDPQELQRLRADEMIVAAQTLGVPQQDVIFLDFPDGKLADHQEPAITQVAALLQRERPAQVFIPYRLDGSPDHLATTEIVRKAVASSWPEATVYEYPVWFWCYWPWIAAGESVREVVSGLRKAGAANRELLRDFNSCLKVADLLDLKRSALGAHFTQVKRYRGDPKWFILDDVSGGEFVACFFQEREIFHRYRLGPAR